VRAHPWSVALLCRCGWGTRDLIAAAENSQVDTLFCLGGNLYAANPDLQQAKQALSQIETIFYVSTKPNLGHFHGLGKNQTLILPVFNRFENPHKTTTESGNNFVRLNDEGKSHLQPHNSHLISEIELITEIAYRLHGENPINWRKLQDTVYIRELIAKTIPGYQKIGEIDKNKEEFTIEGRIFAEPKFKTPDGKAQMFVTPLPQLLTPKKSDFGIEENQPGIVLILGTGRSYGQHNTVVYKQEDKYRNMPHRH
ncbi:MAG: oxidoreductase, partial [Sphaerospermopsis kisseleviana]